MPYKWEQDIEKVKAELESIYPEELTKAKLAQRVQRPITTLDTAIRRLIATGDVVKRHKGTHGVYYSRPPTTSS